MKRLAFAMALVLPQLSFAAPDPVTSPYIGQQSREIKALSSEEVQNYLAGKGMGYAKAAELNGYAGPRHVLDLASQLDLTPEQRAQTQALFDAMQSKAQALGRALIEQERRLDQLFATQAISTETLQSVLREIGSVQSQLRGAHLEAHLAQHAILSPEQNAVYGRLRGYEDAAGQAHEHHGH